jgi:hypothetical protein
MRSPVVNSAQQSIDFSEWLEVNFDLNNLCSAIITRKAEEMFLPSKKPNRASLADEWLKIAGG